MRNLLIAVIALTFSTLSFGRQYIQCSSLDINSWDRMVINLNGDKSTLFMTDGVHRDDETRVLKKIQYIETTATHTIYQSQDAYSIETVAIPNEYINVYASGFFVDVSLKQVGTNYGMEFQVSCFSALYDDK